MSDTETPPPDGEQPPRNKGGRPRRPDGVDPTRSAGRHGQIWDDCVVQAANDGQTMTEFVRVAITRELDCRRTARPVLDAAGDPVPALNPGTVTDTVRALMAGRLPVACGHYIAASEARAGFAACERCVAAPPVDNIAKNVEAAATVLNAAERAGAGDTQEARVLRESIEQVKALASVVRPARTEQANAALTPACTYDDKIGAHRTMCPVDHSKAQDPTVSATPPPGWPPAPLVERPGHVIAVGSASADARHVIAQAAGAAADQLVGFENPSNAVHEYPAKVVGPIVRGDTFPHPGWGRGLTTAEIEQATGPTSPGYDTDGEGNAIEDDDPPFETRSAHDGPPAFPDALTATFEHPDQVEYPCEGAEYGVCGGKPHTEACPSSASVDQS